MKKDEIIVVLSHASVRLFRCLCFAVFVLLCCSLLYMLTLFFTLFSTTVDLFVNLFCS